MSTVLDTIAAARRQLDQYDPDLAVYMVRDLPETKAAGLTDLCWAMYHGSIVCSEARDVLDTLEAWVRQQEASHQ